MQYRECPYCGAHLDPWEICDCCGEKHLLPAEYGFTQGSLVHNTQTTNTICDSRKILGVWLIKARTPEGTPLLVNHIGTIEEAQEKARRAAVRPAAHVSAHAS